MKSFCIHAVIVSVALLSSHVSRAQEGPQAEGQVTYLLNAVDGQTKKHLSGVSVTISGGDFRIPGQELPEPYLGTFNYAARLFPGKYKITISKEGYDSTTANVTITGRGLAETKVLNLTQPKGQPPANPRPAGTLYQMQVIDDATNRKLDDATITFVGQRRQIAATDRKTHYDVPIQPGRYTVTISKAGYESKRVSINLAENPANWQSIQITLARAQNVPKPEARVVDYDLSVIDSQTKKLISGTNVSISAGNQSMKAAESSEPYLGKYNYVARMPPGKYRVTISKRGYDSVTADVTIGGEGLAETRTLKLSRANVEPPGKPERPEPTTYQMQVIDDATNRKLDGATITFSGQGRQVAGTDRKTHYDAPIGPGRYTITISKAGYETKRVSINLAENPATWQSIQVTLARAKNVPKPPAGTVTYDLGAFDAATRKLISGLTVSMTSGNKTVKAKESSEPYLGKYNYVAELPPGKYKVTFSKPGYDPVTADVTIGGEGLAETRTLRFTRTKEEPPARKPLTLWVKVIDAATGTSIPDPTVLLSIGDARLKVSRSKEWHYAKLQSGNYAISVSKAGYVSQQLTLALGAKADDVRTVRLKRDKPAPPEGIPFAIRVIDDFDSKPLSAATVSIKAAGPRGATVTAKEVRGERVLNNYSAELDPGKYNVTVAKTGYEAQSFEATVIREGVRQVIKPIRLKRIPAPEPPTPVTLFVKVIDDETGKTITGADVTISVGKVKQKIVSFQELVFSQLKPGEYTVTVSKSGYSTQSLQGTMGLKDATRTIRLKRGNPPTPPPGVVALQIEVVDAKGDSIPNPQVVITATGIKVTPKRLKGFHTAELKPGRYTVAVAKTGYESQQLQVAVSDVDVKRRVTLKAADSPTPTPDPPQGKRSLTIVVVDSKGKQVNNAVVAMVSPAKAAEFVETAGSYKASGLSSGSYTVNVSKSGYESNKVTAPIGLVDGRRTVILKRIPPSEFVLRVIARDENKKPIVSFETKSDAGIAVELEQQTAYATRLKPGSYEVRVQKQGYETQVHTVTIRTADEQLDVQLKSLKTIPHTPDVTTIPLETQPAGIALKSGKSTDSKVKAKSKGGLFLRARESSKPATLTLGKPGGLGLTSSADNKTTETPDTDDDDGTLTISRKPQSAPRDF